MKRAFTSYPTLRNRDSNMRMITGIAVAALATAPTLAAAQSLFCKYNSESGVQTVVVNFDDSQKAVSMGSNVPLVSVNAKCLQPGQSRTNKQCIEYSLTSDLIRGNIWDADSIGPTVSFNVSRVDGSFILRTVAGRVVGKGSCVINKPAF